MEDPLDVLLVRCRESPIQQHTSSGVSPLCDIYWLHPRWGPLELHSHDSCIVFLHGCIPLLHSKSLRHFMETHLHEDASA